MTDQRTFRIPTPVALLLVGAIIGGLIILTQIMSQQTVADVSVRPFDVLVTNITDTGFSITWRTEKPTQSIISVSPLSESKPGFTFFDDRLTDGGEAKYIMHSVTARGLTPDYTYKVTILDNTKKQEEGKNYEVTTGPALTLLSNQLGPTYGSAVYDTGSPAEGALVYITLPGSQTLSALVKPSGSFLIPLNLIRTEDITQYLPIEEERLPITITVKLADQTASATTDTLNDSPVPEMTLGKSYDFRNLQAKLRKSTSSPSANLAINQDGFQSVLGSQNNISGTVPAVSLLTPANASRIISGYPLISGRGIPDSLITIVLGIENPQVGTTRTAKDGTWRYTPTQSLSAGQQRVSMTTIDEKAKPIAITHLFEVLKSGTQVLGDATPSATPTFAISTPTPTTELTPTDSLSPTPLPTEIPQPTETVELPVTSTYIPTYTLLFGGIFLSLIGLGALFL